MADGVDIPGDDVLRQVGLFVIMLYTREIPIHGKQTCQLQAWSLRPSE